MRTPLLPLLCVLSLLASKPRNASAQIPHAGFEDWAFNGNYADPVGWTSSNAITFPVLTCGQGITNAPEGSYYATITCATVLGGAVVAGSLYAGSPEHPAFPCVLRPAALTGQWEYYQQGGDYGTIQVGFTRWNAELGVREDIGSGLLYFSGVMPQWTTFSVPITYGSPALPDSAAISFISGVNLIAGSNLSVDALGFELSTGVAEANVPAELQVVPTAGGLSIHARSAMARLRITDLSGRLVAQRSGPSTSLSLEPLPPGLYVAGAELTDGRVAVRAFASY